MPGNALIQSFSSSSSNSSVLNTYSFFNSRIASTQNSLLETLSISDYETGRYVSYKDELMKLHGCYEMQPTLLSAQKYLDGLLAFITLNFEKARFQVSEYYSDGTEWLSDKQKVDNKIISLNKFIEDRISTLCDQKLAIKDSIRHYYCDAIKMARQHSKLAREKIDFVLEHHNFEIVVLPREVILRNFGRDAIYSTKPLIQRSFNGGLYIGDNIPKKELAALITHEMCHAANHAMQILIHNDKQTDEINPCLKQDEKGYFVEIKAGFQRIENLKHKDVNITQAELDSYNQAIAHFIRKEQIGLQQYRIAQLAKKNMQVGEIYSWKDILKVVGLEANVGFNYLVKIQEIIKNEGEQFNELTHSLMVLSIQPQSAFFETIELIKEKLGGYPEADYIAEAEAYLCQFLSDEIIATFWPNVFTFHQCLYNEAVDEITPISIPSYLKP